jgi:protein-S-isoprenylcysteine O-methyltransferase Ste14
VLIAVTIGIAVTAAAVTSSRATAPRIARPYRTAGLIMIWLGLATRVWAIAALGRRVSHDCRGRSRAGRRLHRPVPVGPSSLLQRAAPDRDRVRARGRNRLAPAVYAVLPLPLPARLRRIHVEEGELTAVLGDRYRTYQAQTKRVIPGLW